MVKKTAKTEEPYAKKGLSAFMFFGNEHRPKLLEENGKKNGGKKNVGEVAKIIGAMWGKLSDKDKEPFVKKAEKDKLRYDKEIASGLGPKPRKEKKGGKKKKDPNAPKRPVSGYMAWMSENRAGLIKKFNLNPSKVADVAKKAGEVWKSVDEATKKKFNAASTKAVDKWKVEMAQYKAATAGGEDDAEDSE